MSCAVKIVNLSGVEAILSEFLHSYINVATKPFLDYSRCIGCKTCITACPFGGVGWDARTGTIMKCDWCGGEPQCVRICPTGAVQFVRADASSAAKRMKTAERFSEVVERLLTPKGRL